MEWIALGLAVTLMTVFSINTNVIKIGVKRAHIYLGLQTLILIPMPILMNLWTSWYEDVNNVYEQYNNGESTPGEKSTPLLLHISKHSLCHHNIREYGRQPVL